MVADIGQTYNSSITYQHLVADNPDVSAPVAPFLPQTLAEVYALVSEVAA